VLNGLRREGGAWNLGRRVVERELRRGIGARGSKSEVSACYHWSRKHAGSIRYCGVQSRFDRNPVSASWKKEIRVVDYKPGYKDRA
jgi:hypothetical protein